MRKILLFEEERVNEIAILKAQAVKGLGGVSTGIGFWGSPGWALGGAAALGIVEGILSNSARKQALEKIQIASAKAEQMEQNAKYFDAAEITNINRPYPQAWHARMASTIEISRLGWGEKGTVLAKYQKTKHDIIDGKLEISHRYVHDGDEFVHVETDVGRMSIKWQQHVVAYSALMQIRLSPS